MYCRWYFPLMNCSGANCAYSEFLRKRDERLRGAVRMRAVDNGVNVDLHPQRVGLDRLPQDRISPLVLQPTSHGLTEVSLRLLQRWSLSKRVRFAQHSLYDLYLLFAFAETHHLVGLRKVLVKTIYYVLHHVSVHCPKPEEMVEVYRLTKPKSVLRHMLQDLHLRYHNLKEMEEPVLSVPDHQILKQFMIKKDYTLASLEDQVMIDLIALHTQDKQLNPPNRMFGPMGDDRYLNAQYVDIEAIHRLNQKRGRYGGNVLDVTSQSLIKQTAGSRASQRKTKAPEDVDGHAIPRQEPIFNEPTPKPVPQSENVKEVDREASPPESASEPDASLDPHKSSKVPAVASNTSAVSMPGDQAPSFQAESRSAFVESSRDTRTDRGNAAAPANAPTGPSVQVAAKQKLTQASTNSPRSHDNNAPPNASKSPASGKRSRQSGEAYSDVAGHNLKRARVDRFAGKGVTVKVSLHPWITKDPRVQEISINRDRLNMVELLAQRLSKADKESKAIVEVREVNGAELSALLDFVEDSSNSHTWTLFTMIRAAIGALHICGEGQIYQKLLNAISIRLCEEKLQVKDLKLFYGTRRESAVVTEQTASKGYSPTQKRSDIETADSQAGKIGMEGAFHTLDGLLAHAALAVSRSESVAEAQKFWTSSCPVPGIKSDLIMALENRKVHERLSAKFAR